MDHLRHISYILLFIIVSVTSKSTRQSNAKAELEEYIANARQNVNPRYRLTYHVAAPVGWINDPNGFSFYKGQYHLFYQYYPYDSVWGPMHWGHVVSNDLVNWEWLPTALLPEKEQCFSGSAVVDDDTLYLMYTGHEITDEEPFYNQTQYLASSKDGVDFEKYEGNPVLPLAPNGSPDFRDPKVWKNGDHWYVIIGSATHDERGRVLLYRSENLIDWEFLNVLGESEGDMGYMWECPDFFELDGKHVLLWSPQGIEPQGDRYKNTYQTGYIVGNFNYDTFEFVHESDFQEIDFGHDFYATQSADINGRRLLVAWFGMWEVPHPEEVDGWAGAMTIIRELKLTSENKILMKPVDEMILLRDQDLFIGDLETNEDADLGKAAEIIVEGDLEKNIDLLLEGHEGGEKVWLRWSVETGKVIVERENDDIRQVEWTPISSKNWRIFLDTSSVELFCGEGEVVFSSRVYPLGGWKITNLSEQSLFVESYALKRGIPE